MDAIELTTMLRNDLAKYLPQAAARIRRNKHMNETGGNVEDVSAIEPLLTKLVEDAPKGWRGGNFALDVLEAMAGAAKAQRRGAVLSKYQRAALVDFVNYRADNYCIDYAMYAQDLDEKARAS